jgi:hypothetical protein
MKKNITVIVHWENADWVYKHKDATRKILKYYTHTLKSFGYNKLLLVDVDKTNPIISDAEIDFSVFPTLKKAMVSLKNFTFVFVENLPDAVNLKEFKHPKGDTCYIIGSDYGELIPGKKDLAVKISTEIPLWSHVAMAIILNDRRQKE